MSAITQSEARDLRACLRRHHLSWRLGIKPAEDPTYFSFGRAWHAACAGEPIDRLDPFERARLDAMLACRPAPTYEQAECEVEVPVGDEYIAHVDAFARYQGDLVIIERKTTGGEIDTERYQLDYQPVLYLWAAREVGLPVRAVFLEIARKPTLRPFKATPVEARKYTKANVLYANQRELPESPAEFQARCVATIQEAPDAYYRFAEVACPQDRINRAVADLRSQIRLRDMGLSHRNPDACDNCLVRGICEWDENSTPLPAGFVRRPASTLAAS